MPDRPEHGDSVPPAGAVYERLGAVARKLGRIRAATLRETDLTPAQYRVLQVLATQGASTHKALAAGVSCTPGAITSAVDILERKGMARRRDHPNDRRSKLVETTALGRRALGASPELDAVLGCCCELLAPDELRQLGALLGKLDVALDALG